MGHQEPHAHSMADQVKVTWQNMAAIVNRKATTVLLLIIAMNNLVSVLDRIALPEGWPLVLVVG